MNCQVHITPVYAAPLANSGLGVVLCEGYSRKCSNDVSVNPEIPVWSIKIRDFGISQVPVAGVTQSL